MLLLRHHKTINPSCLDLQEQQVSLLIWRLFFSSLTGLNNNCTTDYSIQDKKENTSNIPNSRDSTIHNQVYSCIDACTEKYNA